MEESAAALTGYNGVKADASQAADLVEADFEAAALRHLPLIEHWAAVVLEGMRALEDLPKEQILAHIAAAEGYPELIVAVVEMSEQTPKDETLKLTPKARSFHGSHSGPPKSRSFMTPLRPHSHRPRGLSHPPPERRWASDRRYRVASGSRATGGRFLR